MPVEIRELVIRAVVTEQPQTVNPRESGLNNDAIERTLLIQECVREVLKRLEKTGER